MGLFCVQCYACIGYPVIPPNQLGFPHFAQPFIQNTSVPRLRSPIHPQAQPSDPLRHAMLSTPLTRPTLVGKMLRSPSRFASSSSSASSSSAKFADLSQKTLKTGSELAEKYGGKIPDLVAKAGVKANHLLGSYSGPVSHNLAFAKEVLKQVYLKEKLAPPAPEQFKTAYVELAKNATSLTFWKSLGESGQWKRIAVYGVEAVGLFSIGEMIGRRHIVELVIKLSNNLGQRLTKCKNTQTMSSSDSPD